MIRLLVVSCFVIVYGCKMQESSKSGTKNVDDVSSGIVVQSKKFYHLTDTTKLCPQYTFGSLAFLPEGLQFFCTLHEKNIRYTFTKRDTTIYKDPCFEFFLDPGADGRNYYEFQFNAFPAVWDLKLKTAKGQINAPGNMEEWDIGNNWEIKRIGSINDDSDTDKLWSIYGLIPWENFSEGAPRAGELWSYNFMRADYDANNKPSYWAAYPTGEKMIHYPELWPIIEF